MTDCCNQEDCIYPVCLEQEIADRVREEKHDDGIGKDTGTVNQNDFAECGAGRAKPKVRAAVNKNQERGK